MNQKIQFLIHNKDVQAPNDYYNMANGTYFSCLTENYVYPCNVTTFINHKKQSGSSGLIPKAELQVQNFAIPLFYFLDDANCNSKMYGQNVIPADISTRRQDKGCSSLPRKEGAL